MLSVYIFVMLIGCITAEVYNLHSFYV